MDLITFITLKLLLPPLDAAPTTMIDTFGNENLFSFFNNENSGEEIETPRIHDYAYEVGSHIVNVDGSPGPWVQQNCDAVYNCETISRHHCTSVGYFFSSNNQGIHH